MKAKYIYLLDTCAWVNYYKGNPKIQALLAHIIEQKGMNRATLFMPSFCVAEVFNTFAKWRYRGKDIKINEEEYCGIKTNFRNHIRRGHLISEYPLHIYHIYNTDYVIPFEHQWDIEQDSLSTFDLLIIGMGIELIKHYGDYPIRILTSEKRIAHLTNKMRNDVNKAMKDKFDIPEEIIYPTALYLPDCENKNLPFVLGQKL